MCLHNIILKLLNLKFPDIVSFIVAVYLPLFLETLQSDFLRMPSTIVTEVLQLTV